MDDQKDNFTNRAAILHKRNLMCLLCLKNNKFIGQKPKSIRELTLIQRGTYYWIKFEGGVVMRFSVANEKIKLERNFSKDWTFIPTTQQINSELFHQMIEKNDFPEVM